MSPDKFASIAARLEVQRVACEKARTAIRNVESVLKNRADLRISVRTK